MKTSLIAGAVFCAVACPFVAGATMAPEQLVQNLVDHRPKEFVTTWSATVEGHHLVVNMKGAYELPTSEKQPKKVKVQGTMSVDGTAATVPFSFVVLGTDAKLWVGEASGNAALASQYLGSWGSAVWWKSHVTHEETLQMLSALTGMPLSSYSWWVSDEQRMPNGRTVRMENMSGHKAKFDLTADGWLQFGRLYASAADVTVQTEFTRLTQPIYVPKIQPEGGETECMLCGLAMLDSWQSVFANNAWSMPAEEAASSSWSMDEKEAMSWVPSTEYVQPAQTFMPARGTIEYNNLIRARRNETRWQDVRRILDAVAAYAADKGRLPSEIPTDGNMEICPSWDFCYGGANLEVLADGYLKEVPMDPLLKDRTGYLISQQADGSVTVIAPLAELKEEIYVTRKLPTTNESNRTFLKFAPDQRSSHMQRYEELLRMRQEQAGSVQMNFATKLPGIRVERPSRRMMQEEKKSDGVMRTLWFSTGGQMWRADE